MKMVLVVYRQSLDQDLRRFLKGLDVHNFADAPKVFGIGDAGQSFGSITWPGHHAIILSAMEEDQTDRVIEVLKDFKDHMAELQGGAEIPMKVFVLPCERMI